MTKTHQHRGFPRQLARFLHLAGGQYGTADLLALSDDVLELQLGGDYVQFSREQAEDLRDAVTTFLELERREEERRERRAAERLEEAVEEVVEAVERSADSELPGRRRRKARATP